VCALAPFSYRFCFSLFFLISFRNTGAATCSSTEEIISSIFLLDHGERKDSRS
jgi:hypothetical protein